MSPSTQLPITPAGFSALKSADIRQVAQILCRALFHDPFYIYAFRNEKRRASKLAWLLRCFLRYGLLDGQVMVSDDCRGAAIWLGPERPIYDFSKLLWLGLYQSIFRLDTTDLTRISGINQQMEHWHTLEDPRHYYLMVLGIEPEYQRRGLGSALMRPVLQRADAERLPCYLETSQEANLLFYRKFGFEIVHTNRAQDSVSLWALRREKPPAG